MTELAAPFQVLECKSNIFPLLSAAVLHKMFANTQSKLFATSMNCSAPPSSFPQWGNAEVGFISEFTTILGMGVRDSTSSSAPNEVQKN